MTSDSQNRHKSICSQCSPSLFPENIRKLQNFLIFSGGREKAHWEEIGYLLSNLDKTHAVQIYCNILRYQ